MTTRIVMPQLGESVTEGVVTRWIKQPGDRVQRDEPLVEVMTDKVNAEIPSPVSGVLAKLTVAEGTRVAVGEEIAVIDEVAASGGKVEVPVRPGKMPLEESVTLVGTVANGSSSAEMADEAGGGRYSPLVRRLAREHGVDLTKVAGTGLGGRITKDDVLGFVAESRVGTERERASASSSTLSTSVTSSAAPAMPASPPSGGVRDREVIVPSPMRLAIAEHMLRSKQTAPHAWTMIEVDMTAVVHWRELNKGQFERREGVSLTYLPMVVKATVAALKEMPILNAAWLDNRIVLKKDINIGIAVALDDGLIVPVLRNADQMSVAGLARTIAELSGRARGGRLSPNDVQGGTFTVNNPGAFGSVLSMPIINQGQAAILAMEAVVKRAVVRDDAIAIRSMMNLGLSFDHRIIDGAAAGRFLQSIRHSLEGCRSDVSLY